MTEHLIIKIKPQSNDSVILHTRAFIIYRSIHREMHGSIVNSRLYSNTFPLLRSNDL